jgi:hypothetical protein
MRVLVACEFSGTVRDAFARRGHDAWSCDILPTEKPGNHIQDDVLKHLGDGWDLMIAHPPCTRLCNSGVVWLAERNLWGAMREGAEFFKALLNASIPMIAIENPIPHKYALEIIGRKYDQIIQPWWFDCGETKATCLWLKGLPPLMASVVSTGRDQRIHKMGPSPQRAHERSRTFQGIADAMADQWGVDNVPIRLPMFAEATL